MAEITVTITKRRWLEPAMILLATACALTELTLGERAADRIANRVVPILARFGFRREFA